MKKIIIMTLMVLSLTACTDARRKKFFSFGGSRYIKCYSGGTVIYEGKSTGKISSEAGSDGYFFQDEKTDKLIEVSGDCLMTW